MEILLDTFLDNQTEPFSVADFIRTMKGTGVALNKKEVLSALMNHNAVFEYSEDLFVTRSCFFTGQPFSILPTKAELAAGVLVIGHRCVPFADPEILPHDLTFTHKGRVLGKKNWTVQSSQVFDYYQLFGEEYVSQYLAMDPANKGYDFIENDYALPGKISMTVLDLQNAYKSWGFTAGDRLLCRVTDWYKGVIEIVPVHRRVKSLFEVSPADEMRKIWISNMDDFLATSIDLDGPCVSIDEQLVYAFIYGDSELFIENCASVEEYLAKTTQFDLVQYGVETRLWKKDEIIPAVGNWIQASHNGNFSVLENLFYELGLPVSDMVIDAYILDSLYKKEQNPTLLLHRIIPEDWNVPEADLSELLLHIEMRRDIIAKTYNWFADYEPGQLRSKILNLYSLLVAYIVNLDQLAVEPQKLPQEPLVIMSQLVGHIGRMLESLVFDDHLDSKDIESLYVSLEGMEYSFDEIKETLQQSMYKSSRERFLLVKTKEENDD